MDRTLNWNRLKRIQTTRDEKKNEGFIEGEDDHEQPLSPMTRLFHEPGANMYIIAIIGMKTRIDPDVLKPSLVQMIDKNPRFSSLQTVNDVVIGVLEAGLYRYLNRRYEQENPITRAGENNKCVPKNICLKAIIPFNLRASTMVDVFANTTSNGAWGNKLGYVLLPLNVRLREDPLDYIREVKTKMERKKASLEPLWTGFVANLVMKLFGPKIAGKLHHKVISSVTLCFSNVPGPQEEISFFGHEVAYLAATTYGLATALLIHVVSYVDKVTFVVSVDEETIPDPKNLCDDLEHSLHLIKTSVLRGCVMN